MRPTLRICALFGVLTGAIGALTVGQQLLRAQASTTAPSGRGKAGAGTAPASAKAPGYRVVALWPKPFPDTWVLGSVTGLAVDPQDHIWVVHRGADTMEAHQKGLLPSVGEGGCCLPAPTVLEFSTAGDLLASWEARGPGRQLQSPGGLAVDAKGNIWVAAAGLEPPPVGRGSAAGNLDPDAPAATARGAAPPAPARGAAPPAGPPAPAVPDAHVLKFSGTGQFLMQIGTPGKMEGPDSRTALNRPSAITVDNAANEVYVADSGNHRIVVFDAATGAYKRHWGAYGEKPTADGGGKYSPDAPPSRQFRDVTSVKIAKDGTVYVCDRSSNRIQVFQKNGTFVKEGIVSKNTAGQTVTGQFGVVSAYGSVWDLAFSSDPQQQYVFVADGQDKKVIVLRRDTLAEVGTIGDGGHQPGRFLAVSSVAVDGGGNLYAGEQHYGHRVQKFVPVAAK